MRQEQAGSEAGREPAQEAGHSSGGMRPFPVEPHAGRQAHPEAQTAGFGSHAFTSGQRARWTLGGMVGRSPSMERLFLQMRYLAGHLRCALIEGEHGTGKQLAARTLHELGPVRDRGFVSATADEFLSGAQAAAGLEQVRGGTLHLRAVDALNHDQQGRLLHLLGWMQQGTQGARAALSAGAPLTGPRALILSSSRALRPLVLYGKFRSDLHQQLSAVQLLLPPLRDRRDDIPMLVELFVNRYAESYGKRICGVAQDALQHLLRHPWPQNVKELEGIVSRAVLRAEGEWLRAKDLLLPAGEPAGEHAAAEAFGRAQAAQRTADMRPPVLEPFAAKRTASPMRPQVVGARSFAVEPGGSKRPDARLEMRPILHEDRPRAAHGDAAEPPSQAIPFDANLDRAIMRHIQQVLASVGGNKLRTARLLGISRSTLYRLLDAHAVAHGGLQAQGAGKGA